MALLMLGYISIIFSLNKTIMSCFIWQRLVYFMPGYVQYKPFSQNMHCLSKNVCFTLARFLTFTNLKIWCSIVSCCSYCTFHVLPYRISKNIPTTKDVEPLLEIDGDVRSFEVFLSSRTPVLTARDIRMFLPCTVNIDPKLREIIAGLYF